jgi:hypothetical protein
MILAGMAWSREAAKVLPKSYWLVMLNRHGSVRSIWRLLMDKLNKITVLVLFVWTALFVIAELLKDKKK